jgi:hypothetical protein
VRSRLRSLIQGDDDDEAVIWGAICGPLQDRYLRRRLGRMAEHVDAHAARVLRLLPAQTWRSTS